MREGLDVWHSLDRCGSILGHVEGPGGGSFAIRAGLRVEENAPLIENLPPQR